MILYTLWSNIFIIKIIIIICIKKINSIFDTESKIIHFMGSNWLYNYENKACFQTRPGKTKEHMQQKVK